ncbi:MAG: penicillin-binding transpeptidase domain-containing protein [Verrucomicrobiota bacterium]
MKRIPSDLPLLFPSLISGLLAASSIGVMGQVESGVSDPVALEDYPALPADPAEPATGFILPGEDVTAVEIPAEMATETEATEEQEEAMAEAMTEGADVEQVVAEDETIQAVIERMIPQDEMTVPVPSRDFTEKSTPTKPGQLGSSVLTRTEARTFTFSIPAPRGQILDRNGYPLAQNQVAYYAALNFPFLGENASEALIIRYALARVNHVNNLLGTDWQPSAERVVDHYRDRRWFPLMFSSVLSEEEVEELQRQRMDGLVLHPVYLRHYPQNETLSHVIGYVGKRPPQATGPITSDEPLWGEGIGVQGLEQSFEPDLKGKPGRINVLFEGDGTKIKEDVLSRPQPGHNVVTTIDLEMQNICERLLAEKMNRGAMVIMDVRNGDVMAMASYPQFDPNLFIPSISQENYTALLEDPEKPLFPRAFRATYPPASTFKVATALGYLESGYITPQDTFDCPGSWKIGDLVMRNWHTKGEGYMNVVAALTRSCNTWFYEVSISAGADSMSYMADRLGLGKRTGIPLNDVPGFVPNNRYWLEELGYSMSDGEEAVMSIGQGRVLVTPLQVARMMAAVGNGREVLKPRLVLQTQDYNHEIESSIQREVVNRLHVDNYSLRAIQRGMFDVVNAGNGTGKSAYHKITVSGKTGTGQWKPAQEQNLAWFAGYFPSKYPVYSFAVIYEGNPGEKVSGGKMAAPVIGEFLKEYLTEENYEEVRQRAEEIKIEVDEETADDWTFREPIKPIFAGGGYGTASAEPVRAAENPAAGAAEPQAETRQREVRQGGGIFGIFRKRRP